MFRCEEAAETVHDVYALQTHQGIEHRRESIVFAGFENKPARVVFDDVRHAARGQGISHLRDKRFGACGRVFPQV